MPVEDQGDHVPLPDGPINWDSIDKYIQDSIIRAFGPQTIAAFARAIKDNVDESTTIQLYHPATVIADSYDGSTHTATVQMDSDQNGTVTYAAVLVPTVLTPGQRVMVWFDKPHIAYILGIATLPRPPLCRLSNSCSGDSSG